MQQGLQPATSVTREQLFEFWEESGFLYPEKRSLLEPFNIGATWDAMFRARGELFELYVRLRPCAAGDNPVTSTTCSYAFTDLLWHQQHTASTDMLGTLTVLIAALRDASAPGKSPFIRWVTRPEHPRVAPVVDGSHAASNGELVTFDYHAFASGEVSGEGRVRQAETADIPALKELFAAQIGPQYAASQNLDDLSLSKLGEQYAAYGLERRREVLMVERGGEIVGAALWPRGTRGLSFSLLAGAAEIALAEPDPAVLRALVGGITELADDGETLVAMIPIRYRETADACGLAASRKRQYRVLTRSVERAANECESIVKFYVDVFQHLASK